MPHLGTQRAHGTTALVAGPRRLQPGCLGRHSPVHHGLRVRVRIHDAEADGEGPRARHARQAQEEEALMRRWAIYLGLLVLGGCAVAAIVTALSGDDKPAPKPVVAK